MLFSGNRCLALSCSHELDGRHLRAVFVASPDAEESAVDADITITASGNSVLVHVPKLEEEASGNCLHKVEGL